MAPSVRSALSTTLSIPVFPPELCRNILDDLCDDRRSLSACSLTCWAWAPWARRHLFENVILTDIDHCLSFVAILKSSVAAGTSIQDYVRTVKFSSDGYTRPEWRDAARWAFRHLPNIDSLQLTSCNYNELVAWVSEASYDEQVDINATFIGSLFSSFWISSLSISMVSFRTWADFWTLCTCFPSLTRLVLMNMQIDQPLDLENPTLDIKANDTASMPALTTITSLVVASGIIDTAIVLRGLSRYPFELHLRQVDCFYAGGDDPRMFDAIMSSKQSLEYLHLMIWNDSFLRQADLTKHTSLQTLLLGFSYGCFDVGSKPYTALPTFLARLHLGRLRDLTFYIRLPVPLVERMSWEFFDWPDLDRSLAVLAKKKPALRVTFDLTSSKSDGDTIPDIVGPLVDRLRNSLVAGMMIKAVVRGGPLTHPLDDSGLSCWLPIPHDAVESLRAVHALQRTGQLGI
ncbi:uncharacterized protein B0H18DRAFT_333792 [Fomitopsis serialis]|uniref:uncharacterized protein n=1 Tax=Fomitopsis serialis TaxID=139415 RepID=UPI0020077A8A|nr:uncharacterized protein B0H18DRAFT_333792 [Neoantrodia serialis]KAH9926815.1 hypothetical protein B0H18DRAFT_333792 [Neoantrodia serialis]